jgi:hypothetical protein
MKTRTNNPKEIVAWVVLIFAAILFSVSFAFAQDKKKKDEGKVHINIIKEENGKKIKIDTTVAEKDLPAFKEYLKEKDIDFDPAARGKIRISKDDDGEDIVMNLNHGSMSNADKEKFRKEMKKLHQDLGKMKEEMKDIHIEMFKDGDDDDDENFNFHMRVPPSSSSARSYSYSFNDEDNDEGDHNLLKKHSFFFDNDIPDSLRDEEHIVVRGREGEEKPEFEKEITGKNGEKIWVYKRKLPASAEITKRKGEGLGVGRLKVYPNPSDGKISVSFKAASKGDVKISITDSNGKEVYTESLKNFEGEYFQQVDITGKGKGSYYIKITSGDDAITKKILVE